MVCAIWRGCWSWRERRERERRNKTKYHIISSATPEQKQHGQYTAMAWEDTVLASLQVRDAQEAPPAYFNACESIPIITISSLIGIKQSTNECQSSNSTRNYTAVVAPAASKTRYVSRSSTGPRGSSCSRHGRQWRGSTTSWWRWRLRTTCCRAGWTSWRRRTRGSSSAGWHGCSRRWTD